MSTSTTGARARGPASAARARPAGSRASPSCSTYVRAVELDPLLDRVARASRAASRSARCTWIGVPAKSRLPPQWSKCRCVLITHTTSRGIFVRVEPDAPLRVELRASSRSSRCRRARGPRMLDRRGCEFGQRSPSTSTSPYWTRAHRRSTLSTGWQFRLAAARSQSYAATLRRGRHTWLDCDRRKLFVAGEWIETGDWLEVRSPYSGDVVGRVAKAGAAETKRAIDAAERAMREPLPAHKRAEILVKVAGLLGRRHEEVARLISRRGGQADQGRARRGDARDVDVHVRGGRGPQARGRDGADGRLAGGRGQARVHAAPAARDRRRDHAVQLPAATSSRTSSRPRSPPAAPSCSSPRPRRRSRRCSSPS